VRDGSSRNPEPRQEPRLNDEPGREHGDEGQDVHG
jgi:hypothetical protein